MRCSESIFYFRHDEALSSSPTTELNLMSLALVSDAKESFLELDISHDKGDLRDPD